MTEPGNANEATILKATRMVEATYLYGLEGYDLLQLIPVGSNSDDISNGKGSEGAVETSGSAPADNKELLASTLLPPPANNQEAPVAISCSRADIEGVMLVMTGSSALVALAGRPPDSNSFCGGE